MRILTWNLWWRCGPWRERRAAILETLRDLRPDIIGLQEVWGGNGENLAGWLAEELGMAWTWAPFDRPGEAEYAEYAEGVAILSRWPIADRDVLPLPSPGSPDTGRVALYALVDADPQPVPFFTAHLNYLPAESAVRCAQVRALSEFVAAHQGEAAFPAVVTGDLNASPDSAEIRLLRGPSPAGQRLLDAWDTAEPGAPWATWNPANPYLGPEQPAMRIDYVHVGEPGLDGLGRVRSARRVGDGPVEGVWPSDHAAVLVELEGRPTA